MEQKNRCGIRNKKGHNKFIMEHKHLYHPMENKQQTLREIDTGELIQMIDYHVPSDGVFNLNISGLHISRCSHIQREWDNSFYLPSVFIVVQGEKVIRIGKEIFNIGRGSILMIPVALPVALKVVKASTKEPYLGIGLTLDPEKIVELALKVYPSGLPSKIEHNRGYITEADAGIIQAFTRLMECTDNPSDEKLIAPIIMDEIIMRLLRSQIGPPIAEMSFSNSSVRLVAAAIEWLRNHFNESMKVSELAELSHMSVSVFHKHFKEVTSMSPIQYQKALRLQEARNLMLSKKMDALTASQLVGYASASQFNRDYRNYFGNPPRRDMEQLLNQSANINKA